MVSSGTGGYLPTGRALIQNQMAAAARLAAQREAALRRRAASDQKQMQFAQEAEQDGDLPTASRLYQRLALRKPPTAISKSAQEKLANIQADAFVRLDALVDELKETKQPDGTAFRAVTLNAEKVTDVFDRLDALQLEYAGVATVESRIEEKIKNLRLDRKYAAVLQEPAAAELWAMGQDYEKQQQACCAVLVYEQAVSLVPAPSANLARARLTVLSKDATVIQTVKQCRVLQLCHAKFREAEKVKASNPDKAREQLARILELAPADTQIHKAAREQIAMLR